MKICIIATNISHYKTKNIPTGLWLSEITHFYHTTHEHHEITIASPNGGKIPIDPESLRPIFLDTISKNLLQNTEFQEKLNHSKNLAEIAEENFDCIYLSGGHGTMFDFPENPILQKILARHYENGKIISAICHGVDGLLNVKIGEKFLIENKNITGFCGFEEILANRSKIVPFNLENALKNRGAKYQKIFLPFTSCVVEDENLVTGQNPFSSKELAKILALKLQK